jgi:hypothetical protein
MSLIRELGRRGKLHADFTSVPDVFRVIDKLEWTPQHSRESASTSRGNGDGFHTFKSLEECIKVMRYEPEKLVKFNANDEKLVKEDSIGKEVRFDITGDFLDIDRYLEGDPEVFGNAVMGNPKGIFCTINILSSYVYYTSAGYILERQKRITRLVDWLEQQQVRCQIVASLDSAPLSMSVIVKEFHDPFDVNHLAVVSHPDWLRRVIFLIKEQSKTWEYGYGSAIEYDKRMIKYTPKPEDGMYIYVGGYIPHSGGGYRGGEDESLKALNREFDDLENKIEQLIADGLTYNEEPFAIAGGTPGW